VVRKDFSFSQGLPVWLHLIQIFGRDKPFISRLFSWVFRSLHALRNPAIFFIVQPVIFFLKVSLKKLPYGPNSSHILLWHGPNQSLKKLKMQPKFTLKKIGSSFRLTALLLLCCSVFGTIQAQTYVNGTLSSGATALNGTAAPAGNTWSECQNVTGNTTVANQSAGFGAQIVANNSVADDFTVPAGPSWNLTKITVYAYSTGAAAGPSPFTDLRLRIHSSNPMTGPTTIVYGDLATNRLAASSAAGVYRIFNTLVPPTATGTTRIVWKLEANVSVTLAPGTYWLEFQTGTALTSNFVPSSADVGVRTLPSHNAIQSQAGIWSQLFDTGITQAGVDAGSPVAMAIPFRIDYSTGACSGTPAPGATIASATTVCPGINVNLSLTNPTNGSGVTYQWQVSTTGVAGTYTNIPGATNSTLSTTQTVASWYRANVTCSAGPATGTSTPVAVATTPAGNCYCAAGATSAII
jgi:hypothetical protein